MNLFKNSKYLAVYYDKNKCYNHYMILLNLLKNDFKSNEKWPLLYVIAQVYCEESALENSLTDVQVCNILQEKFNLNVERRTIGIYRRILTDYFGIEFIKHGYGHIIKNLDLIKPKTKEDLIPEVDYLKDIEYSNCEENIEFCLNAIKDKTYLTLGLDDCYVDAYIKRRMVFTLIPIKVFHYRHKYFLFSYSTTIDDYFIVDLEKHYFRRKNIKVNPKLIKKELNLRQYLKEYPDYIVTGRVRWIDRLDEHQEYDQEDFTYRCNPKYIPEVKTCIDEKYGDYYYSIEPTNESSWVCDGKIKETILYIYL